MSRRVDKNSTKERDSMKKHNFGKYQTELDTDATAKWYSQSEGWGCDCGHCRNFLILAKNKELPKHIIEILDGLGIPPEKATYVGELFTDDKGIHYQFSYRIAGKIIETPDADDAETWIDGRCCHVPYPYGAPNFPKPHFDLEFYATLPRVLEDT